MPDYWPDIMLSSTILNHQNIEHDLPRILPQLSSPALVVIGIPVGAPAVVPGAHGTLDKRKTDRCTRDIEQSNYEHKVVAVKW